MKTAIITGASGDGIGRSTAITMARDHFQIVVNYRTNKTQAESICSYINRNGGNATPIKADIFQLDECKSLVEQSLLKYKEIDACIIGPGAGWNPEPPDKLNHALSIQDLIQEISPIYALIPLLIPEMAKNRTGRIIGISSNQKLPSPSYSYNTAKCARIDALIGLSKTCWKHRITVNVIAPGPIEHIDSMENAIQQSIEFSSAGEKVSPQDVAEIITFLCSEKGRYITGNVIEMNF